MLQKIYIYKIFQIIKEMGIYNIHMVGYTNGVILWYNNYSNNFKLKLNKQEKFFFINTALEELNIKQYTEYTTSHSSI